MQKITPFLWFDGKAEEAMNFYVSVFKNSRVVRVTRNGEAGPGPKGTVMSATFQLDGQDFFALNGGPQFVFTASDIILCELRDAAGSRRAVGKAFRGREKRKMRLAERQIWTVMANHSLCSGKAAARSRC